MLDNQVVAVQSGYWAGYYSNSKRPKSIKSITEKILSQRKGQKPNSHSDYVDVEEFLKREQAFNNKKNSRK